REGWLGGGSGARRNSMNRREMVALGLASLSTTALSPARAQSRYPERPIRLLVPFSAGGVVDAVGRQWAERVKPHLGTIVVENQGGAGGTIATGEVARAQPDGYTALLANTSVMGLNPAIMPQEPKDPVKDLAPVAILAISASGIMIPPRCRRRRSRTSSPTPRPTPTSCPTARPAPGP